jgi:hypothetical protein
MSYKISYDNNVNCNCGYYGCEFEEGYISYHFPIEVKNKLLDTSGTEELINEFQDVTKTGFDKDLLVNIFSLSNNPEDLPAWRVGEAFAEFFLEERHGARFYYNPIRDAKNPDSNLTGADLVGFIDVGSDTIFLFGEVKTSSDKNSPPQVLYGRSGLINQLENLKSDEKRRNNLVRYLGFKAKNLPKDNVFRKDYSKSLRVYRTNRKQVQLFGILVRDTESNELDLYSRFQALIKDLDNIMKLQLVALYIPVKMPEWNKILISGGVKVGS